jgi:hypothetical protein
VCSNNCTFDDFDVAFDSLVAGDTITVKQGYTTLAARTVTLNNITIWYDTPSTQKRKTGKRGPTKNVVVDCRHHRHVVCYRGYNATFGSNSDVWLTIPTNVSLLFKGSSLIFGTCTHAPVSNDIFSFT